MKGTTWRTAHLPERKKGVDHTTSQKKKKNKNHHDEVRQTKTTAGREENPV